MAIQQPAPEPTPASAPAYAPAPAPAPTSVERVSVTEEGRYNFRAAAVVGFVVGLVDILIAARFLGKLLGASSQSAFVHFIYQLSSVMVAPFTGIFGDTGTKTNTFETASLVAIVVYAVIGWGLVVLIRIVTAPHGTKPATS
jgi:YGGT family